MTFLFTCWILTSKLNDITRAQIGTRKIGSLRPWIHLIGRKTSDEFGVLRDTSSSHIGRYWLSESDPCHEHSFIF